MSDPRTFVLDLDKVEASLLQSQALAGHLADRMLADPKLRDRVEKAAAAAIDRTIAKMIEAKLAGVLDDVAGRPIPSGYGGSFKLREFVQAKIAEWAGTNHQRLIATVESMVRNEVANEIESVRVAVRTEVRAATTKAIRRFNQSIAKVFKAAINGEKKP